VRDRIPIPTATLVVHLHIRPPYAAIGKGIIGGFMAFTFMVPARSDSCHPLGARRPRQGRGFR
jgi:hypothetical protein